MSNRFPAAVSQPAPSSDDPTLQWIIRTIEAQGSLSIEMLQSLTATVEAQKHLVTRLVEGDARMQKHESKLDNIQTAVNALRVDMVLPSEMTTWVKAGVFAAFGILVTLAGVILRVLVAPHFGGS